MCCSCSDNNVDKRCSECSMTMDKRSSQSLRVDCSCCNCNSNAFIFDSEAAVAAVAAATLGVEGGRRFGLVLSTVFCCSKVVICKVDSNGD